MKRLQSLLLLLELFHLAAVVQTHSLTCNMFQFNCESYDTTLRPRPAASDVCTPTRLEVTGVAPDVWNDGSTVKTLFQMGHMEWLSVKCDRNTQCGVGLSFVSDASGGIRSTNTSVGFYVDAETAFWGSPETPTPEGWNRGFGSRLIPDEISPSDDAQVAVDYQTSTVWYKHPGMKAIDFLLPESFHCKPLYGHVQVWNSNSLTLTSTPLSGPTFV